MQGLQHFLTLVLLVSLRIVPALAFSPPFTLVPVPATVRLFICLNLSAWMASAHPSLGTLNLEGPGLIALAGSELIIGIALALTLQLAFAAMQTIGRAIDLQAGYAFAMIADPSSRTQMPLIGMLFAYAGAAVFFSTDGPANLLAIWSLSLEHVPVGTSLSSEALPILAAYLSSVFVLAFGAGGLVILVLFMVDGAIALVSRTLPQMNVLFLGFQIKAIATLAVLPIALAGSAAFFLRMLRMAFDTMLRLI